MCVKIAHISDIHYERRDMNVSDNLRKALKTVQPNILVVTGDFVDNPWKLGHAKNWLLELCTECQIKPDRQLIIVPGNHDYRLLGNFGFKPLTGLFFRKYFGDWHRRRVIFCPKYNVTFLRIDSNPSVFGFARGRVWRWQLGKLRQELDGMPANERDRIRESTKIAILHHHPLPVPYEGADTFLMLKNAQELIQFLTENKVEMVLHGHKHRAPYSLLSLGTCIGSNRVIEVLGAGTAVVKPPDLERRGHNFNVITIESTGLRYVRQFFAQPGQEFVEIPSAEFVSECFDSVYRRSLSCGYEYRKVHWDLVMDEEGDRFNEISYKGLRAHWGRELPHVKPPPYTVDTGHLSHVWLNSNKTSEGVGIRTTLHHPRKVAFEVSFRNTPTAAHPVDFSIDSYDFNSVSVDLSEFKRKFPTRTEEEEYEEKEVCEPMEEFSWALTFPADFTMRFPPRFEVLERSGDSRSEWLSRVLQRNFTYSDVSKTALLSIQKPPTNYRYRISWTIPAGPATGLLTNPGHKIQIRHFARDMLARRQAFSPGGAVPPQLLGVMAIMRTFAHLVGQRIEKQISCQNVVEVNDLDSSLMVYDDSDRNEPPKLRIVAGTYMDHPQYWDFCLEVGDGNAGRAYKKNIIRSFDAKSAAHDPKNQTYIAIRGVSPHRFLYSMPLRHSRSQHLIFAILNIGTFAEGQDDLLRVLDNDDGNRWLLDQAQQYVLTRLLEVANIRIG